ncbi:hypothetical protein [Sporosarcina sp. FSL K6-3457]|uniref:hypothetical protein n=1 Tax=Sporosarcina sp. FSL K6-3457 TaxID=2978204 RepID=UPI0030FADD55
MRKLLCALFTATIFLSMMVVTNVSATSWVEMDPEEVSERAEVVVSGTYDFTGKAVPSDFIFAGFTFNVENVYRGEVPSKITVGIDGFDVGWADEFQNEGGKFLLFSEKSDSATFLIPVGGPNGMIQFSDGKVQNRNTKNQIFYEDILKSTSEKPSSESDIGIIDNQNTSSVMTIWIGGVAVITLLAVILLYRYRKKGKH